MNFQGDFHVHTNFCPHGSSDRMETYVKTAIEKNLNHLTFTEHAPLPKTFIDPAPEKDSCMKWHDLSDYCSEVNRLQQKYKDKIAIKLGFEVDYLIGREQDTKETLDQIGPLCEDAILSVHMLKAPNGEYVCVDYSDEEFSRIVQLFGSLEAVYKAYYDTVKQSICSDLGQYKPNRIGHITLIQKFSKKFPLQNNEKQKNDISEILALIKEQGYELDVNTAGFFKPYCGESYPPLPIIQQAYSNGIPLVLGSDSHRSNTIAKGFIRLPQELNFSLPQSR